MHVLSTEEDDGIATMTISIADDDHKFDVWTEDGKALVKYQETLSWRGQIRVSEPDEEVYKALMVSDEMTELLEDWGVSGVQRARAPEA
jgi:hypothetical protein